MFRDWSRQIGKVGKEQTSRHLLPAWRSHNAIGDFYFYSKRWQNLAISANIARGCRKCVLDWIGSGYGVRKDIARIANTVIGIG